MPLKAEKLKKIAAIPALYNQYFVKLGEGNPEKPDLPEIPTAEELGELLTAEVPQDFEIGITELNEIFDAAKLGFAYIKLFDERLDKRFSGTKRITEVEEENSNNDQGLKLQQHQ